MDEFSLIEHFKVKHPNEEIKCGACGWYVKSFSFSSTLIHRALFEHSYSLNDSASQKEYDRSNVELTNEFNFIEHLKVQHANKKIRCKACNIVFCISRNNCEKEIRSCTTTQLRLSDLIKATQPIQKFPCNICDKTFTKFSSLNRHKLYIHEGRKITCDLCDKTFCKMFNLNRHKLHIHGGIKFKCNSCDKTFSSRYSLKCHNSRHGAERKKQKCNQCDKVFLSMCSLKRHVLVIHGGKRFECPQCHLKMKSNFSFNNHVKTVHSNDKPLQPCKQTCALCNYSFLKRSFVLDHYKSHHQLELVEQEIQFDSLEQVFVWKKEIENSTRSRYVISGKYRKLTRFICNRSGLGKSKVHDRKRRPRAKGSTRLGFVCPAEIKIRRNNVDPKYTVFFLKTHIGHNTINPKEPVVPRSLTEQVTKVQSSTNFSPINPKEPVHSQEVTEAQSSTNFSLINTKEAVRSQEVSVVQSVINFLPETEINSPDEVGHINTADIEFFNLPEVESIIPQTVENFGPSETENISPGEIGTSVTAVNKLVKCKNKLINQFVNAVNLITSMKEAKVVEQLLESIVPNIVSVKTACRHHSLCSIENCKK